MTDANEEVLGLRRLMMEQGECDGDREGWEVIDCWSCDCPWICEGDICAVDGKQLGD
jgi:hypothetical protein